MVYINTTGKVNEVWLDKPYGTIIVDCPDCPESADTWTSGYTSGYTDGLAACSGSPEDWQNGYNSGHTDGFNEGWPEGYESGFTDGHESGYTDGWQPGYDSGFTDGYNSAATGNPGYDEGYDVGFDEGYVSGVTDQKNKLTSTAITQNGTYTRADGFNSVYVNVPQSGYTQSDLDAAFQSGITYQKSLLTSTAITGNGIYNSENGFNSVNVQVECPSSGSHTGTSLIEIVYKTTGSNQTIQLFNGDAQDDNKYFNLFLSAITYMEVDGQVVLPSSANVYNPQGAQSYYYFHTFQNAGLHTVKYYMDKSVSGTTDRGDRCPASELDVSIFYAAGGACPIVSANIGEVYEYIRIGAFQLQSGMTALTVPSTMGHIQSYSLENTGLKTITSLATVPPSMPSTALNGVTTLEHIYVPAASVDTYKAASGWSNYASIIEAIQ